MGLRAVSGSRKSGIRVRSYTPTVVWMLKRSVVDRKIAALAAGRDLYLGL